MRSHQLLAVFVLALMASINLYGQDHFPLDSPCNPVSSNTCGLPYPSDVYAVPDSASPTGSRLIYPEGVVDPELYAEVPPTLTPQTVVNGSSGYSAATSVLFELTSEPDLSTLHADGGDSVFAFNLNTGERIPIRVQVSEYARSNRVASPSQIVEIYPRSRWDFGERYAVFLTQSLKPLAGGDYYKNPQFEKATSNDGSPLADYYEPVIRLFERNLGSRETLISSTFFTVRDEQEATGRLREVGEYVYNRDHPVRNLRVLYPIFGSIAALVSGEVLVHDFRDQYGGMVYDTQQAKDNWIRFRLALPRAAINEPVPVSIFGHGLGLLKESALPTALRNAGMGIATVVIDHPNHGSRIEQDGGYALGRMQTRYVPLQLGMMVQSSIDHMALLKAVQTSIGELDVLPKRFWSPIYTDKLDNGDGIADIDTDRIFYEGTSLGGVLGSAFVAIAPDIKGAVLNVSGVGVINILSGSALWDPFFSRLVPDQASGAEALLLKAAMQHELDYGDAINFVQDFREPQGIATAKPVVVVAAENDTIIPNFSTIALADIADLPLVGEEYFPLTGAERSEEFDNGYGVLQLPAISKTDIGFFDGLLTHFSSGRAEDAITEWIEQVIE